MKFTPEITEAIRKRIEEKNKPTSISQKMLNNELNRIYPEKDWKLNLLETFNKDGKKILNTYTFIASRRKCCSGGRCIVSIGLIVEMKNKLLVYILNENIFNVSIKRPKEGIIIRNHCPAGAADQSLFEYDIERLSIGFKKYLQAV